jgi:gas vesicle protein
MVDAIPSIGHNITVKQTDDVKNLVKYTNNQVLKEVPDTFTSTLKSGTGSAAVFEGLPFLRFLFKNKKVNKSFINGNKYLDDIGKANQAALENLKNGKGKLSDRIFEFVKTNNESKNIYVDARGVAAKQAKQIKLNDKLQKLNSKNGLFKEHRIKKTQAKLEKVTSKLDDAVKNVGSANKVVTKQVKLGKVGTYVDDLTKGGYKKLVTSTNKGLNKIATGKFGKFMKSSGTGIQLVFSGVSEACFEVIPTFKELGKEKGMKQVGKSTVKVLGDTVGFVVGEQVGMAAGTAAGTALAAKLAAAGTAISPGIGTVIGGVVGFIGGMLGSFIMGKITTKIVGKSEREIAEKEAVEKQANEVFNNKKALEELKSAAALQLEEEYNATGELSEDSKIAQESLNKLNSNPFNVVV